MRAGTTEPASPDQILRRKRGQGNIYFPRSAGHEQDWQPRPVDPFSAICDDHTYVHPLEVYPRTPVKCFLEDEQHTSPPPSSRRGWQPIVL